MSISKWMDKEIWYIACKKRYYLALKKKEILILAVTKIKLEDIMFNEISQPQKDKDCMIPLMTSKVVKLIETGNRKIGAKNCG